MLALMRGETRLLMQGSIMQDDILLLTINIYFYSKKRRTHVH